MRRHHHLRPDAARRHREPDNSFIHATARAIAKRLRPRPARRARVDDLPGHHGRGGPADPRGRAGSAARSDFLLAFSPEREDPGNARTSRRETIPKVVGGVNPAVDGGWRRRSTRRRVDKVVPVSSARVAESCKLLENIFRSVNIALVNELKMIFDRMGIDVWEVIEAAKTKPFGFMPFYPGPGSGRALHPARPVLPRRGRRPSTATWARFIELAGEINTPHAAVRRAARSPTALNEDAKPLKGSRVLVLGLAYKANIDDDRESPSYEIIELLEDAGAQVDYCDPFFPAARKGRKHDLQPRSVPATAETFARYDAVVVVDRARRVQDPPRSSRREARRRHAQPRRAALRAGRAPACLVKA